MGEPLCVSVTMDYQYPASNDYMLVEKLHLVFAIIQGW